MDISEVASTAVTKPTYRYPNINTVLVFCSKIRATSNEINKRLLTFTLINFFFARDLSEESFNHHHVKQWWNNYYYNKNTHDGRVFTFLEVSYKNESFFDHGKDIPLLKRNRKPSIKHQIYMYVPKTIWYIYNVNILSRDDWSKESWNNAVITNNHDTTDDGYWGRIEFSITDHEVLRRISPEHKLIFIISDRMFTHSNNLYWLETLPSSIHVTGGGKYPMTVVAKMRSEKLKDDSYLLKTDIFVAIR